VSPLTPALSHRGEREQKIKHPSLHGRGWGRVLFALNFLVL